jgi:hypothetical protein
MPTEEADKAKPKADDPQQTQRLHVDFLFSKYVTRDLAEELTDIANFFSFLSERILPNRLTVDVDPDLLERFEPVYLLLLDKLSLYPPSIRSQAEDIVGQANVCNLMAIAGVFRRAGSRRIRVGGIWRSFLQYISIDVGVKVTLDNSTTLHVNSDTLFRLKVALTRLAGIVRYASSLQFVDYDETFHKFKRNYDPDLVDRSKLLALLNILRMDINAHPTSEEKDMLLSKLEHIEQELKRQKVRWGVVITSFFILFGFLADLKTLKPNIYDKPHAVVQQILSVLHGDGLVSNKPPQLLPEHAPTKRPDDLPKENEQQDQFALPPRKREDDEPAF